MASSLLENRLTRLTFYLHDESLSDGARKRAIETQVRLILRVLRDEPAEERGAVMDYLTLLGFNDLIAEQS